MRSTESVIISSYPTSVSEIIVLLALKLAGFFCHIYTCQARGRGFVDTPPKIFETVMNKHMPLGIQLVHDPGDFSLKVFFKNCSYFLIFPYSRLVHQNNKKALRNACLLLFHPAICERT